MSINKSDLIEVRVPVGEDYNFIMASWLNALRHGNEWFKEIDKQSYYKAYQPVIQSILVSPTTAIRIACLKEDSNVILGFSAYSGDVVHFVFVKKAWRGIGIAKSLVPQDFKVVSHLTDAGRGIIRKRKGVKFNPFVTT